MLPPYPNYRQFSVSVFQNDSQIDFIVMVSLPPDEKVLANFNFHFDIKGGSDEVMKKLKSYPATMRKAEEVLEVLFDG
jgi:hypothetical protein